MTLRILITGSRNWTDIDTIREAIAFHIGESGVKPRDVTIVHGAAPGADTLAGQVAAEWNCHIERHRADWARHGKAAGPIRNTEMVTRGADHCLAFPIGESRGTRDCMRQAHNAGIPVTDYGKAFE